MKNFVAWFTPERRQAIQVALGSLAPLAILLGFGSEGAWEQWLIVAGATMQAVASFISLVNVRDANTAWAIVRGAVYLLASTVSPALVALGYLDESTSATILLGVSLGLGALSNLLAILIGKQQQIATLTRPHSVTN